MAQGFCKVKHCVYNPALVVPCGCEGGNLSNVDARIKSIYVRPTSLSTARNYHKSTRRLIVLHCTIPRIMGFEGNLLTVLD